MSDSFAFNYSGKWLRMIRQESVFNFNFFFSVCTSLSRCYATFLQPRNEEAHLMFMYNVHSNSQNILFQSEKIYLLLIKWQRQLVSRMEYIYISMAKIDKLFTYDINNDNNEYANLFPNRIIIQPKRKKMRKKLCVWARRWFCAHMEQIASISCLRPPHDLMEWRQYRACLRKKILLFIIECFNIKIFINHKVTFTEKLSHTSTHIHITHSTSAKRKREKIYIKWFICIFRLHSTLYPAAFI